MATSLNNLAGLYDNQGQYAKAEPLFERALAIRERRWARSTRTWPRASTTWRSLYRRPGPLREGRAPLPAALAISEKALGPEHPDVATCLNNLAELYQDQGQHAEAEPLLSGRWRSARRR